MIYHRKHNKQGEEIDGTVLTASENDVAQMEFRLNKQWLRIMFFGMMITFAILATRIIVVMIINNDKYKQQAQSNSTYYEIKPAPRGVIFDRNGTSLVENIPQIDVMIILTRLSKNTQNRTDIIHRIAQILSLSEENLAIKIQQAKEKKQSFVLISRDISQDNAFTFEQEKEELQGVHIVLSAKRHYIDSTIFSHILGYTGPVQESDRKRDSSYYLTDHIGKTGIEKSYEHILRGHHGKSEIEVDALGKRQRTIQKKEGENGKDIHLTIDSQLQKKIYDILEQRLTQYKLTRASVIAIDPRNGSVRALVSIPSYDNNLFVGGISDDDYSRLINNPDMPLFNRVVSGTYAPGSTIKPFLAGGALKEKIIDTDTTVTSTGSIRVGNFVFRDWRVNGVANVKRAIAVSHDIFFYAIGGGYGNITGLGVNRMKKYYNLFGFGEKTLIDLPNERAGMIPSAAWKKKQFEERWYIGNDYHMSIGQGYVTATPLQLAVATGAIANNGTLWRPHLLSYSRNHDGALQSFQNIPQKQNILPQDILKTVQEGMRMTVTEGTAQMLKNIPVAIAGKTGTAQFGNAQERTHSWFSSYAPYENPEIVLVVLVESQSKTISSASVPVANDIYKWLFEKK